MTRINRWCFCTTSSSHAWSRRSSFRQTSPSSPSSPNPLAFRIKWNACTMTRHWRSSQNSNNFRIWMMCQKEMLFWVRITLSGPLAYQSRLSHINKLRWRVLRLLLIIIIIGSRVGSEACLKHKEVKKASILTQAKTTVPASNYSLTTVQCNSNSIWNIERLRHNRILANDCCH